MRAGVFDSGIGGISVLKPILKAQLFEEVIYYGDTARVPYGGKDQETIIRYALEALDFFKKQKIDILIIACNTVSAYALDILQNNANFPIIGVIDAGIKAVTNKIKDKNSQILILATQATTKSKAYPKALQALGYHNISSIATSLFVPFVEEGIYEGDFLFQCFNHYLSHISPPPQAIILGCTHYPFIAKALNQYFNSQSILIHSGEAIVEELKELNLTSCFKESKVTFCSSQNNQVFEKQALKLLQSL